jgi:hypothetical protein
MSSAIAALERARGEIDGLIEAAAEEIQREQDIAAAQAAVAIAYASSTAATAAAYQQGRESMRIEVLAMLEAQRETLARASTQLRLSALIRSIRGAVG